ncbi:MAG: ABC transporter permease [Acidothermales bacterium]|nr:ABC transporter permease [Acidothermales bacterium]
MTPLAQGCLAENAWLCGDYVRTRSEEILSASQQHVFLTVVSVALGFAIAFPVALLARRFRAEGAVLGVTTGLYTVPSLALFGLLLPFTGLGVPTVIIALVIYSLTILVRNVIAGLEGVPEDVRESARGMGFGPVRQLFSVELPLALPAVFAGLRIATVSTVALVTVGALIGAGGLGNLIYEGLNSVFRAQVLTASALCVVIAVAADLLLLGVQRMLTPWQRGVQ